MGALKAYVKVGDIKGGVTMQDMEGYIKALSFHFRVSQDASHEHLDGIDGRRSTRGVHVDNVVFTKLLDQATIGLFKSCCQGTKMIHDTAELHILDDDQLIMKYLMEKVIVSEVSTSGSEMEPVETVSLNFDKITLEYQTRDGGSDTAEWNIRTPTYS